MEKIKTEPEIVSLFGSEYEKVPRFFYVNEAGEEVVASGLPRSDGGRDRRFLCAPAADVELLPSAHGGAAELPRCESALVPRFRLDYREVTPDQVDAYTRYMEGNFTRLDD